jgi:hypothetical protein
MNVPATGMLTVAVILALRPYCILRIGDTTAVALAVPVAVLQLHAHRTIMVVVRHNRRRSRHQNSRADKQYGQ